MKNVIVYNQLNTKYHGAERWDNNGVSNYLKCQIDNSIRLGWDSDDIILGTNFDFEYNGIKSHTLTNICEWSGFHNFWYGALELVQKGIIKEEFWLHDHDSWQIAPMEFPEFNGYVAGVEYGATSEWNCGSIYFNKGCVDILSHIVEALEINKDIDVSSDEVIIGFLRNYSPYKEQFVSINSRWNVGMTYSELRYANAIKPAIVLSFKPDEVGIYQKIKQKDLAHLLDPEFQIIINKHFNNESN